MNPTTEGKKQIPVMEGLFPWPVKDERLIGNKCKKCGQHYFPVTFRCGNPDCQGDEMEEIKFSKKGKLWSYTINFYPLPPPFQAPKGGFVPFGIGAIEFPEGIRVCGIITNCDAQKDLKIGMDMELVLDKLYDDEKGNEVIGWKFQPVLKKK